MAGFQACCVAQSLCRPPAASNGEFFAVGTPAQLPLRWLQRSSKPTSELPDERPNTDDFTAVSPMRRAISPPPTTTMTTDGRTDGDNERQQTNDNNDNNKPTTATTATTNDNDDRPTTTTFPRHHNEARKEPRQAGRKNDCKAGTNTLRKDGSSERTS